MDEKSGRSEWNSSLSFLIAMVGAAVGLGNIWRFSYVLYDNGGGAFFIPYIFAILIMGIPFLILEYGLGFKFKATLSKILYNIKPQFEILGWFTAFLVFMVLTYYTCIMGWDLVYFILSFFKGWGANPDSFFVNTLLHSTESPYGLTYLVVPIGIALATIWGIIYYISHRNLNDGVAKATKIFLPLLVILMAAIVIFSLQLPGAWTGLSQLYKPDWYALLNINIWLAAFGQIVFSLSMGQAIAVTYASYLPKKSKLTDNVLFVVLSNSGFEIFVSLGVFAILGFMSLSKGVAVNSLITEGTGLVFVVYPTIFNVLGNWAYIIGPIFFLCIFFAGITSALAFIEPLSASISEKFNWSRKRAVKTLSLIGLAISLIFATGMGNYLLGIADAFINQFGILLAVLLQAIVFAWFYGVDKLIKVLNDRSFIKVGKKWIIVIKYVLPIVLTIMWVVGLYNLFLNEDLKTLAIQGIIALIFVIVPLVLTLLPRKNDNYHLDAFNDDSKKGFNYFKSSSEDKDIFDKQGHFVDPYDGDKNSSLDDYVSDDDLEDNDSKSKSEFKSKSKFRSNFVNPYKNRKKKTNKNVLKNVDLSSDEFDYVSDDELANSYSTEDGELANHDGNDELANSYSTEDGELAKDSESSGSKFGLSKFKNSLNSIRNKSSFDLKNNSKLNSLKDINPLDKLKNNGSTEDAEDYFDDLFDTNNLNSEYSSESNENNLESNFESKNKSEIGFKSESNSKPWYRKSKNDSKDSKSKFEEERELKNKAKSKFKSNNSDLDSKPISNSNSSQNSKSKSKSEEELIFDEFKEDFFDDDIFGDEGYEYLLDDYVPPKKSSKSKKNSNKLNSNNNSSKASNNNSSNGSNNNLNSNKKPSLYKKEDSKGKKINSGEGTKYDYEGKGIDSVFDLDE